MDWIFGYFSRQHQRILKGLSSASGQGCQLQNPGIPGQPQSYLGLFMGISRRFSKIKSGLNTLQFGNRTVNINFML